MATLGEFFGPLTILALLVIVFYSYVIFKIARAPGKCFKTVFYKFFISTGITDILSIISTLVIDMSNAKIITYDNIGVDVLLNVCITMTGVSKVSHIIGDIVATSSGVTAVKYYLQYGKVFSPRNILRLIMIQYFISFGSHLHRFVMKLQWNEQMERDQAKAFLYDKNMNLVYCRLVHIYKILMRTNISIIGDLVKKKDIDDNESWELIKNRPFHGHSPNRSTFDKQERRKEKRQDIQGLRAIAIGLVLAHHFLPKTFPNGYLGVDIFFVISGYIMALVRSRESKVTIKNSVDFYYLRLRRIIPCLYLVTLLSVIAMILLLSVSWQASNQDTAWSAVFLQTNYLQIWRNHFYFARGGTHDFTTLFLHTWSLAVEMQFYLVVPPIFFVLKNVLHEEKKFCFTALAFFAIASWIYNWSLSSFPVIQFNHPLARGWQFLLGIVVFYLSESKDHSEKSTESSLATAVLQLILVFELLLGFYTQKVDDFNARSGVTAVTAVLLAVGSRVQTVFLSNTLFSYIGNISYVLYLVHWPILGLMKYYARRNHVRGELLYALAICIVVSVILHHFFEKVHLAWSKRGNIIPCVVLFVATSVLIFFAGDISRLLIGQNKQLVLRNLALEHHDHENHYHPEANYTEYYGSEKPWGLATFPPGNGSLKVLMIGNSYATQQMHVLKNVLRNRYRSLHLYAAVGNQVLARMEQPKLFQSNIALVETLKPDVVVIATRWHKLQKEPYNADFDALSVEGNQFVKEISKLCKQVLIVGPHPLYQLHFLNLYIDKLQRGLPVESMHMKLTTAESEMRSSWMRLRQIVDGCSRCKIINTAQAFTDREHQRITMFGRDSQLSYVDNSIHFTSHGLEQLQEVYRRALEPIIKDYDATV